MASGTTIRRPLAQWLHVSRRRGRIAGLIVIAVLLAVSVLLVDRWGRRAQVVDRVIGRAHVTDDPTRLRVAADDGRTILVALLGVRVPAQWRRGTGDAVARKLSVDRRVLVHLSAPRAGRADDVVAGYVYLADGTLLNEWLIDQGLARSEPSPAHRLARWFGRLERWARGGVRGHWAGR
jgi:hypothetical protein